MEYNDGEVKIPVERYDFLRGLELMVNEGKIVVAKTYGMVDFYTNNEAMKRMKDTIEIEKEKCRLLKRQVLGMSVREFRALINDPEAQINL